MPEFGVRLALGCAGADLWRRVVFEQLQMVLSGAALGVGLAAWASRLLASLLPETARFDAAVVAGAVALLAGDGRRVRRDSRVARTASESAGDSAHRLNDTARR